MFIILQVPSYIVNLCSCPTEKFQITSIFLLLIPPTLVICYWFFMHNLSYFLFVCMKTIVIIFIFQPGADDAYQN